MFHTPSQYEKYKSYMIGGDILRYRDIRQLNEEDADDLSLFGQASRTMSNIAKYPWVERLNQTVSDWTGKKSWLGKNLLSFESPILKSLGLTSWGRVGAAAAGLAGLALAYKMWKNKAAKEEQQQKQQAQNASFVPDYTNEILIEADRYAAAFDRFCMLLTEVEEMGEVDEAKQKMLQQKGEMMTRQIASKANSAASMADQMMRDPMFAKAPPEIQQQVRQLAAVLARAKGADPTKPVPTQA